MGRRIVRLKKKSARQTAVSRRRDIGRQIEENSRDGLIFFLAQYDTVRASGASAREAAVAAFSGTILRMRIGGNA